MKDFHDRRVTSLYYLIVDPAEPIINQEQKTAIEFLWEHSATGNADATAALNELLHEPFLHPLLREMVFTALTRQPAQGDPA
ncbi:MAG: hypothetical protein LUO88_00005 [Methanoregulaceae archaeon]|nr:hypothetical protein [Methanoregulaceae archaeon]